MLDPQFWHDVRRSGRRVFIPGSSGAPTAAVAALMQDPACSEDLDILTSFAPGINRLDIERLHPTARVSGPFMQPGWTAAQRAGRYRPLPMSYAGFVRHLEEQAEIDVALVQVAPPDAQGRCSLGPSVEFLPTVLRKAAAVVALVNPQVPRIAGAPALPLSRFIRFHEVDCPLATYTGDVDATAQAVAFHVSRLVQDGSALQVGLGKVPHALTALLRERRGLRLWSGMFSDGLVDLVDAGALDPAFVPTACTLVGSAALYRRLPDLPALRVTGCDETHDLRRLLNLDGLIAVNSALEVDLFGQANLEYSAGRLVSGPGGAPDFARAARLSRGGLSVLALAATHGHANVSRIVPRLSPPGKATLSATDIDCVVTEHGVAHLTGLSVAQRARALIDVAAPDAREALAHAWDTLAATL